MGKLVNSELRRTCKRCGYDYHPTSSRQMYCNQLRQFTCVVCGQLFDSICGPYVQQTCSSACQAELTRNKLADTAKDAIRTCEWCGKEFHPKTARSKYCEGPHYQTCCVCSNQFEIQIPEHKTTMTCSRECKKRYSLQRRDLVAEKAAQRITLLNKYGVENAMQIPGAVERVKQTNRDRYGADWYTQTERYRLAVQTTSQQKYGCDHFLSSNDVIAKRVETCQEIYGTSNAAKSAEVRRRIQTVMQEKYGVVNVGQSNIPDMQSWEEFKCDPEKYIHSQYAKLPSRAQLCNDLGVSINAIYDYMTQEQRNRLFSESPSRMEDEIIAYIQSIDPNITIIHNDRKQISPQELDIYLPEYNFAIECNPTATHNSTLPDIWGGPPKPIKYHQIKTDKCADSGIFLLHVFGYEWVHKRPILESIIANKLHACNSHIYARETEVRKVGYDTAAAFLNQNHRQGNAGSSIRLGLYYQNELVCLMTFSKVRHLGAYITDEDNAYELVRFCSKLDTSVVGGASKLFIHFIRSYTPDKILSYSDRAHTQGQLYAKLGFIEKSRSDPGYLWVNMANDQVVHRMHAQKHNIAKMFPTEQLDLTQTEAQIMQAHNFAKVYDSGVITWIWQANCR